MYMYHGHSHGHDHGVYMYVYVNAHVQVQEYNTRTRATYVYILISYMACFSRNNVYACIYVHYKHTFTDTRNYARYIHIQKACMWSYFVQQVVLLDEFFRVSTTALYAHDPASQYQPQVAFNPHACTSSHFTQASNMAVHEPLGKVCNPMIGTVRYCSHEKAVHTCMWAHVPGVFIDSRMSAPQRSITLTCRSPAKRACFSMCVYMCMKIIL